MTSPDPAPKLAPTQGAKLPETAVAAALMCLAVTLFSCLDASAKFLIIRYDLPTVQVTWMRFVGQFIGLLVLVPVFGGLSLPRLLKTQNLKLQLIRSLLMAATTVFNFLALKTLRLDQTTTIFFLGPLVVALLAGPTLGEWIGWRRLIAILVGFLGILIAVRPGLIMLSAGLGYAFLAMLAFSLFMLLTRHMAGKDPRMVTLFYSMVAGVILGAPIALSAWVMPVDTLSVVLLGCLGVFGGVGHYLFILAYERAPASTIAPFLYLQLVSMVALGFFVFSDLPDRWTLLGSAIVIASGLYMFHRERVHSGM